MESKKLVIAKTPLAIFLLSLIPISNLSYSAAVKLQNNNMTAQDVATFLALIAANTLISRITFNIAVRSVLVVDEGVVDEGVVGEGVVDEGVVDELQLTITHIQKLMALQEGSSNQLD